MLTTSHKARRLAMLAACSIGAAALGAAAWTVEWTRTTDWDGYDDRAQAAAIDSQGSVLTAGLVSYSNFTSGAVEKRDADGVLLWSHGVGGVAEDVVVGVDDKVYVGGSRLMSGVPVFLVVRYSSDGTEDWRWGAEGWGIPLSTAVHSLHVDADGYVYAGGAAEWFDDEYEPLGMHWAVWKISPSGQNVRSLYYVRDLGIVLRNAVLGVTVDSDGAVIAAGIVEAARQNAFDAHVRKWDSDGSVVWDLTLGDSGNLLDAFASVAVDEWGDVYVVGSTDVGDHLEAVLHKISSDGQLLWTRELSGNGFDMVFADVVLDPRGYPVVVGTHYAADSAGRLGVYDYHGTLIDEQWFTEDGGVALNGVGRRGDSYALAGWLEDRSGTGDDLHTILLEREPYSNRPPTIDVPPSVSEPLAAVGEVLGFEVGVSDADGDPLIVVWDFGDDGSARVVDPTHSYATPGGYGVRVSVTDGLAEASSQVAVTVGEPLEDTKIKAWLNFKRSGRDRATYRCGVSLPKEFDRESQTVAFDLAGVRRTFTLNRKGVGKNEFGKAKLKYKRKKGYWRLDVILKKGDYQDAWADEGLVSGSYTAEERSMKSSVEVGGLRCAHVTDVRYWAKPGVSGRTK